VRLLHEYVHVQDTSRITGLWRRSLARSHRHGSPIRSTSPGRKLGREGSGPKRTSESRRGRKRLVPASCMLTQVHLHTQPLPAFSMLFPEQFHLSSLRLSTAESGVRQGKRQPSNQSCTLHVHESMQKDLVVHVAQRLALTGLPIIPSRMWQSWYHFYRPCIPVLSATCMYSSRGSAEPAT
jgi:hypothetical protein